MKETTTETGFVLELNGKFWGLLYDDWRGLKFGWCTVEQASIRTPNYSKGLHGVKLPLTMFDDGPLYSKEMKKGRILQVKKTTILETIE